MELSSSIVSENSSKNVIHHPNNYSRRPTIIVFTGFRALACFWVFFYHRAIYKSDEFQTFHIDSVALSGRTAVALFFCLSGFIMVWIYGDCHFKSFRCYWAFLGRRMIRLFPLYYLSLIISVYDIRCVWNHESLCTISSWISIVLTLLGIRSWIPYIFKDVNWNFVIWSVQTEFFFYVVFPFILNLIRSILNIDRISLLLVESNQKRTMYRLYWLGCICLVISAIPSVIQLLLDNPTTIEIIFYSPYTRVAEFCLGIITGIVFLCKSTYKHDQTNIDVNTTLLSKTSDRETYKSVPLIYRYQHLLMDIFFVLQIIFFMGIHSLSFYAHPNFIKYHELVTYGPLIALLVCFNLYLFATYTNTWTSKLLSTTLLVNMGNISYAFYCLVEALPKIPLLISGTNDNSIVMRLSAGIGISVVAHHYFEVPIYNWIQKKIPKCDCLVD